MPELEHFPTLSAAIEVARIENKTMTVDIDGERVTVAPDGEIVAAGQSLTPIAAKSITLPEIKKGNGSIRHNFDGDKARQWRLSSMCTNGQSMNFDDLADDTFPIQYWYVHTAQITKPETGQVIDVPRIVLLSDDLRSLQFTSVGIMDSLMQLVEFMGEGPYSPPLEVRIRKIKTPAGHTYSFEPATELKTGKK